MSSPRAAHHGISANAPQTSGLRGRHTLLVRHAHLQPLAAVLPYAPPMWSEIESKPRADFQVPGEAAERDLFRFEGGRWSAHIEDGWDAMENSVSGTGCRPTITSAVYAEARAVSRIAAAVGNESVASRVDS